MRLIILKKTITMMKKDDAYKEIINEDIFFKNNMDRLDLDSDNIDLELLEKFECAQFLGQRLQMINERWKKLTNINKHEKLQNAIKLKVMRI